MEINDLTKNEIELKTTNDVLQSTIQKVSGLCSELFPDVVSFGDGSFILSHGSASVMVIVRSFNADEACVECLAHVVSGANITPELMKFLLRKNSELHFGGFGLLFDGTVIYSYTISARQLDKNELSNAVQAVSMIADYYDDEIVAMAGGKRAQDVNENDL